LSGQRLRAADQAFASSLFARRLPD
jgi:hypothetical protein